MGFRPAEPHKLILLCRSGVSEALQTLASFQGINCIVLNSKEELQVTQMKDAVLIGFSTGVLVPEEVLKKVSAAYNFHPGSPLYPGRDPHYWAIYDGADTFGCTAHAMEKSVDSGGIIGTLMFSIEADDTAELLRAKAEIISLRLYEKLLLTMMKGRVEVSEEEWVGVKRTRKDFFRHGLKFEGNQQTDLSGLDPYDLGNAHYFGIRTPKNKEMARKSYCRAAALGSSLAREKLERLFETNATP
jgi:folate-dependent phosphoribosylglycinamide formyltransferase PurN